MKEDVVVPTNPLEGMMAIEEDPSKDASLPGTIC